MRNQTVNDKVKIFISSRIDEKFTIVRKALKLLLEETNMCEVFAFEKSNASTEEVISYYLDKIEDVDLCIFLIDNKSGVSDAVLKYDKPVYGMFIAVRIDTNTAETFRHGIWYARGDVKQRLDIVPLTRVT